MYDIMTPGPTQVRENVRQARALACTNPDLDADFYDFYKETCEEISELLYTKNEKAFWDWKQPVPLSRKKETGC